MNSTEKHLQRQTMKAADPVPSEDVPVTLQSSGLAAPAQTPATEPTKEDAKAETGLKYDGGKTRADLLPMGAVLAAGDALRREPSINEYPWRVLAHELGAWRRREATGYPFARQASSLAIVTGCLLVLLTRELAADSSTISNILPDAAPALHEIANVLTFGAKKYSANSWQNLENFNDRYYAALLRHLFAVGAGEDVDPESGLLHLAHAACGALFLLSAEVGHDPS